MVMAHTFTKKIKVKTRLGWRHTDRQTDTTDCITFLVNAVSNKRKNSAAKYLQNCLINARTVPVSHRQSKEGSILWTYQEETRELPGERDSAENNARCTQARKATHGLDGQHQDLDMTASGRVNQNERGQR